jgi:hypothetical protein
MGVQGVPFFIVDQAWAVSGAQPPAAWVQAIQEKIRRPRQLRREGRRATPSSFETGLAALLRMRAA